MEADAIAAMPEQHVVAVHDDASMAVAEHVPMPAIDAAPIEEGAPVVSAIVDTVVDADGTLDSAEEKRLKRMRRNRESAAQSRNRKKAYVDTLEADIRALKTTINQLNQENYELRKEQARLTGGPEPAAPEAIAIMTPVEGVHGSLVDEPITTHVADGVVQQEVAAVATTTAAHEHYAVPEPVAAPL